MLQAITFDFWNTLYLPADSGLDSKRLVDMQGVLASAGYVFTTEQLKQVFKSCWRKAHFQQRVYGTEMTPKGHLQYMMGELGAELSDQFAQLLFTAYTETLLELPPQLNYGVTETLSYLKAKGYKLAVICNTGISPGVILRQVMRRDAIFDFFDFLVFSDEVYWAKPNVKIFAHTLHGLACSREQALHIGDDPITDVIGAKKSGMQAVWLAPHNDWKVPEADYHFKQVDQLQQIL